MTECPTCDGLGYLDLPDGSDETCPDCDGSGEVDPDEMREAAMYRAHEARDQDDRTAYGA